MSGGMARGRLQVLQIYRLLQCVHEGDRRRIEEMVNLGVENLINLTEPRDGTGVLHVAVSANDLDLVSFLLANDAHPNVRDRRGRTPVMLAAELGNDAIVTLLTQKQADLKLLDAEGKGVLFYCNYPTKRHTRCLQLALKNRADVNNVSAKGLHVFQTMCEKAYDCSPLCLIMLDAGADPDATNQETGVTALMEAARAGSLPLVRAILRRGGNPNALDKTRLTAVHYAAMGGFFEVIQMMSAYSADMGSVDLHSCTPLHYAAATGNANCCKFLAQRGCNPKLKNQDNLLPRQIAKDAGHKAAAKELRKAERQQGKGDKSDGVSLMSDLWALTLHDWSNEFQTEIRHTFGDKTETVYTDMFVLVLEELNAPVKSEQLLSVISAHDKRGEGSINITDFIKGVKYIKKAFLLSSYMPKKKKGEKGGKGGKKKKGKFTLPMPICTLLPELKPRRPDGGPPYFMIETYYNCSDVHRFDRSHPPEHPIINDSGWYVEKPDTVYININYCVKSGNLETLDLAFSQGVPVDVQDEYYKTPLMVACSSGNVEVVQYLLSQGADVNVCDQFFWTPLHHAAHAGHLEIVDLLLKAGAAVDSSSLSGGTALMRAIESAKPACVDLLIRAGASVSAESSKGKNCLDIAVDFGDSEIVKLVKDKMDSLPKAKDPAKEKGGKSKPAKKKSVSVADTLTATPGKTPTQTDSKSVVLQNSRITAGKVNTVDISFVPKTVWGKPPSTSQLMSKIESRRERLSLDFDFDDLLMPFSRDVQRRILEQTKTKD
ncbi:ankyrin repeat and EF-hand domain-containing protein 1a [Kryptolebias marmoratus]|uniref:ankyrin repeat and EF-hand domain-containing protein 1a n=1 Tax=Kryptolebias marmoratus TaxID=37003 RepID=UPI000D52F81C|nr:ankyrin repeat and EF-hand domain-containing protein 1a [Kryptolebias marmoratus]